jgi:thioredoxin 1
MKIKLITISVFLIACALPGYCNAGELQAALSKAQKEGRFVMLELGSVGCVPCEQMKPVMKKLRTDYDGKLEVLVVDVQRDKDSGKEFRVFAIPTQVFLDREGREFHRHMGYYAYEEIVTILKKAGL